MKLWLISQDENTDYDTYDSAVVAAADEETARHISPCGFRVWKDGSWHFRYTDGTTSVEERHRSWTMPENVKAELIGEGVRKSGEIICASFNAG